MAEVTTTKDARILKTVDEMIGFTQENEVIGVAVIAFALDGGILIRWSTQPRATASVNLAVDVLKTNLVSGSIGPK